MTKRHPAVRSAHRSDPLHRGLLALICTGLLVADGARGQENRPPGTVAPSKPAEPPAGAVSAETIGTALDVIGLEESEAEREMMVRGVRGARDRYQRLREQDVPNHLPPALRFAPLGNPPAADRPLTLPALPVVERPKDLDDLAFASLPELAHLVASRKVSCVELTELALARLERLDPELHAVVSLLPERARARAARLDELLDRGQWLGPLHGIPYGAKDLLAAKGAPTTWGAAPFADQVLDHDAAVVKTLDEHGAVLVAKLSLGALAMGDVWFGGRTRNPHDPERGSSGSSAGPAAATAAGMVPFAIGSETLGSIVSPSVECGVTGFRPTFGVVDTRGAMVLSWSMDKLGPICRSAEDAALVFQALTTTRVVDTLPTTRRTAYPAPTDLQVRGLRVGVLAGTFEDDHPFLAELRDLGVELVPFELPDVPAGDLVFVLSAEAAAAFDELTRSGRDEQLVRQAARAWPNEFRVARLIPAVEYLQAQRLRTRLMQAVDAAFATADVSAVVHPTHGNQMLVVTNLTGHPSVAAPRGRTGDGRPDAVGFTGRVYGDVELLRLVIAWEQATDQRTARPLPSIR